MLIGVDILEVVLIGVDILEVKLIGVDILEEILSNPIEFKKKSGEPGFYQKYEDLKIKLENSFIAWEKTVEKSSALNEELKKLET